MTELATTERRQDLAAQDQHEPMELMQVIAQAARDPQVDVTKMQALLQMKREEEDRDAKRSFNSDFVRCKGQIKPVFAKERNQQTNSNYADAKAIAAVVDPFMDQYGFAITYSTEPSERDGYYRMVADLLHKDGHEKRYTADIPIDKAGIKGTVNKTDTHAFGSSMTYGKRYLKLLIWDIATTDDDGNGAGAEPISMQQAERIHALLDETGSNVEQFCKYLKVETVADIPVEKFSQAVGALEQKKRQVGAAKNQETLT